MSSRESFVRWFGEDNAQAVEQAAEYHLNPMSIVSTLPEDVRSTLPEIPNVHGDDDRGSDEFRYLFLCCIGYACFTDDGYRDFHGLTVKEQAVKDWCIDQDLVRSHDGAWPDYLGLLCGVYDDWMLSPDAARWQPEKEDQ